MIAPVLASAETVMIDGINYVLNADKKTAAVYAKSDKYSGNIIIPDQIEYNGEDYIVNYISEGAFADCILTSLTIGKNVTTVDPLAFARITVPSLIIGNSISSIPIMAFLNCNITTLTIGESVTNINYDAFKYSKIDNIIVENDNPKYDSRNNCNAIIETKTNTLFRGFKNSTIPNDVTSIGSCAFYWCTDLTSISIPNGVTCIGGSAFVGCSALTSVVIPNGVTSIGSCAFEECSSLTSIEIPSSVTSIGVDAFYECNNLTAVHITDIGAWCNISFPHYNRHVINGGDLHYNLDQWYSNPLYIAHHLYLNGEEVKDLVIPNNATIIGDGAFIGCNSITSVSIPNNVTSIGIKSFSGCANITSVDIPESVKSIGDMAFAECNLASLNIGNGVTSIGYKTFINCSGLTYLAIPNSVKTISSYAFSGCSGLTSVVIPNSVTTMGEKAFENCTGLISVTIGGVSSFSADAFDGCSNLKTAIINSIPAMSLLTNVKSLEKITLGNDITKIEFSYITGYKSLKSITIGNSVSEIGERAFANLDNLMEFVCSSVNVPNTNRTAFENSYIDYVTLYVPAESVDKYKSTAPWSGFKEIIAIEEAPSEPETVTINGICYELNGNNATILSCSKALTSAITIPELLQYNGSEYCVTTISHGAFANCNISSVNVGNNVTLIGDNAFQKCENLTSITIPDNVTYVGSCAFYYCTKLASVSLSNSLELIDACSFEGCTNLTSITIPDNVKTIGEYAFQNSGLTSVIIPDNTTSIKEHAFTGCSKLSSVNIGKSIESIGSVAFANCESLTDVTCYATTVPTTKSDAFDNSNINNVFLFVPTEAIDNYKASAPWNQFKRVVVIGSEMCATPTIDYKDGKLVFSSATNGAECVTTITSADVDTHYGNEVSISYTYNISTYAKADGYANSDVVTAMLIWIEKDDATTALNEKIEAKAILVQAHDGTIRISSAEPGTVIEVYNVAGIKIASVNSQHGTTQIATTLNTGDVSIVKIGKRTVKVVMR